MNGSHLFLFFAVFYIILKWVHKLALYHGIRKHNLTDRLLNSADSAIGNTAIERARIRRIRSHALTHASMYTSVQGGCIANWWTIANTNECNFRNKLKLLVFYNPKNSFSVWSNKIPRKYRQLTLNDRVCELHFNPDDMKRVKTVYFLVRLRFCIKLLVLFIKRFKNW